MANLKLLTKLFVGNLPDLCRKEDLEAKFKKYGNIVEFDIISNFGFVHYQETSEAQAAADALNGTEYNGNQLRVEISHSKVRHKPGMGTSDECYRCGMSGHWSKDCPRGPRRPRDTENRPVVPSRHEPFVREPYPKDPYLDSYYRSHYPASPPIRYDPYYDLYERRHLPPLPRELYYREQLTDLYGRPIAADYFMRRSPPPVSSLYARSPYEHDLYVPYVGRPSEPGLVSREIYEPPRTADHLDLPRTVDRADEGRIADQYVAQKLVDPYAASRQPETYLAPKPLDPYDRLRQPDIYNGSRQAYTYTESRSTVGPYGDLYASHQYVVARPADPYADSRARDAFVPDETSAIRSDLYSRSQDPFSLPMAASRTVADPYAESRLMNDICSSPRRSTTAYETVEKMSANADLYKEYYDKRRTAASVIPGHIDSYHSTMHHQCATSSVNTAASSASCTLEHTHKHSY